MKERIKINLDFHWSRFLFISEHFLSLFTILVVQKLQNLFSPLSPTQNKLECLGPFQPNLLFVGKPGASPQCGETRQVGSWFYQQIQVKKYFLKNALAYLPPVLVATSQRDFIRLSRGHRLDQDDDSADFLDVTFKLARPDLTGPEEKVNGDVFRCCKNAETQVI